MRAHTKEYREYLGSLQWYARRKAALASAQHRCERCGLSDSNVLEVHHKRYENLGHELPEDLEALCPACHAAADDERRSRNHKNAAKKTYAEKKYGDDWQDRVDPEQLDEEFSDWLDRQRDD